MEYPGPLLRVGVFITLSSGLIEIFGWAAFLVAVATKEVRFCGSIDGVCRF